MIIEIIKNILGEIDQESYLMRNPEYDHDGTRINYSQEQIYPERNFVSDLKSILVRDSSLINNTIKIHNDLYKKIIERLDHNPHLKETYHLLGFEEGIYPDLIIHGGQHNTNADKQIFAMECKINPSLSYDEFRKDLFKLSIYKEILNYKENLYLIVNVGETIIREHYNRYLNEGLYISNSDIEILVIECYNASPVAIIGDNKKILEQV